MYFVVTQEPIGEGMSQEIISKHIEHLKELMGKGVVVIAGPFSDEFHGGMIILETETKEEARELVDSDPAVKSDMLKNKIRPYDLMFNRGN